MKAIILAGGFGTRLRERLVDLPKPMAPIAGKPFLEYILERLANAGIDEIILSVGYLSEVIISHFGNAYKQTKISYSIENEPLGTGGAIAYALEEKAQDLVLVINGDTLLNMDYRAFLETNKQSDNPITMVLKEVSDASRYGSVLVEDNRVTGFTEKGKVGSGWINAGVYLLHPSIFKTYGLAGRFSLETDLLQKFCANLSPKAYLSKAYFIDIGIPEDYDRAQIELPNLS